MCSSDLPRIEKSAARIRGPGRLSFGLYSSWPYALTPTDASSYLGLVQEKGHGLANPVALENFFNAFASRLKREPLDIAQEILEIASSKIKPVLQRLVREYKLDWEMVQFVGGGGGACAIVPFSANRMKIGHSIAQNCEVISAIGAALGIIKDSVERSLVNPTESDLIAIRQEAIQSVLSMGAVPESVEVMVEIDTQNKRVIATALGSSEMRTREMGIEERKEEELLEICARSLRTNVANLQIAGKTSLLYAITAVQLRRRFFGLVQESVQKLRVIDREGAIRLQIDDCLCRPMEAGNVKKYIPEIFSQLTSFGDAGALVPDLFLLVGGKILDMTGLVQESQIFSLLDIELARVLPQEGVVVIAAGKK